MAADTDVADFNLMMMTFTTQAGKGQGKTDNKRKAQRKAKAEAGAENNQPWTGEDRC